MGASSTQLSRDAAIEGRPPPPPRVEADDPFALLEQLPGAVLLLDGGGRIVQLNGIAELRLDLVRGEALGRDLFRDVLPTLEAEGVGPQYRAEAGGGRTALACEVSLPSAAGPRRLGLGIRACEYRGRPAALVLVEDRSALAEEEARRKRAEQLATIGELAGGVAHEVNNPLASIKGFAQLLARDAETESQAQGLEIISQECTRAAAIIDRLLDFSLQQHARSPTAVDLSALLGGVLDLRQYALETSGIEVVRELDGSLSPVLGDRGGLQRVVLALLRQAERSLAAPRPQRRIVARTGESTDGVVLSLLDNGPGIPRERLRTLLTAAGPDDEGGGFGLPSALEVVREHGGHLWVESAVGGWTAYFVRLPRLESGTAAESGATPSATVHGVPSRPLRVLVADDEGMLRLALALFLGRHGHEVVQAADAYEAERLAREERFDAVLADAHMPGDGRVLLERLEAIPHLKGRTVLMTGDHVPALDADGTPSRTHLLKPFDMTEVIRLVETLGR